MRAPHPWLLGAVLLVGSACPPKPAATFLTPTVVIAAEDPVLAADDNPHVVVDQPISFLVTLTDDKGAPLTNYEWVWISSPDPAITTEFSHVGPGVERIQLTSTKQMNAWVTGQISICVEKNCHVSGTAIMPTVNYTVWGGLAHEIVVDTAPVKISLGEKRRLLAIPVTDTPLKWVSHEAVTVTSQDPTTIAVLPDGRIEGRGVGETTLVFISGLARKQIKATVNLEEIGPPPEGISLLASGFVKVWDNGYRDHMAVDAQGYPVIACHAGVYKEEMLLARWTGTGFGFDRIAPGVTGGDEGRLFVDSVNHAYFTYYSNGLPVVLDANLNSEPIGWRKRRLSIDLEAPRAAGLTHPESYVVSSRSDRLAFLPRAGSGAFLAYTVTAELVVDQHFQAIADDGKAKGILGDRCMRSLMVADVNESDLTFKEQEHVFYFADLGKCDEVLDPPVLEPQVLKTGETFPHVSGADAGIGFVPSDAFFSLPTTIGPLRQSLWPRPVPGIYEFEAGSKICTTFGPPIFRCFEPLGARFSDNAKFVINEPDNIWDLDTHDPGPALLGTHDSFYFLTPWEGAGHRLLTVRIPAVPAFNGTENGEGARITNDRYPAPVLQPLHVRADGRRFLLTEALPIVGTVGALLSSPAANQAFTSMHVRDPLTFDPISPVMSAGTTLQAVRRVGDMGAALMRSTDNGATWTDRTQTDISMIIRAGMMDADGGTVLALSSATGIGHQVLTLHTAPDGIETLVPIVPFTPPATWSDNTNVIGLVSDGAGNAVYVSTIASPGGTTATYKLVFDRFDFSGTRIDTTFIDSPGDIRANTVVREPNGDFLFLRWVLDGNSNALRFVRVHPATQTLTTTDVPLVEWHRPSLIRLPSGTLVIGATIRIAGGKDRAVTLTSTDGTTWSEPKLLRPEGGAGQIIYSMATDADGTLVVVLGDSGSIATAREWENAASLGISASGSAPLVPLVRRISDP